MDEIETWALEAAQALRDARPHMRLSARADHGIGWCRTLVEDPGARRRPIPAEAVREALTSARAELLLRRAGL